MSDLSPCFSEDIWFEILKNLPVKLLGKCRCVCKSWHSLIVSPSFMAAHLKHYTQNDANTLILYKKMSENQQGYEQCVLFRDSDQLKEGINSSLHTSTCPVSVFKGILNMFPCFELLGCVYGLLCLSDDAIIYTNTRILIWNPILQKCIKLPMNPFTDRLAVLGFGYDSRKKDHRVVRIYLDFSYTDAPLVEVFSVHERTRRFFCGDYLVDNCITDISSENCFVNGVIHWITCENEIESVRTIRLLLFNVSHEEFDMMELPESNISRRIDLGIFEYHGMLSVSYYDPTYHQGTDISGRCQIWVQRIYNVASSWCKILDVTPLPGISLTVLPVQYLGKNGELLGFFKKNPAELVYYDTRNGDIKELGFRTSRSTSFSAYSESLIFLDQEIPDHIDDTVKLKWYVEAI